MESFLSGVALAFLSGLTWLAYRHPDGFPKIANSLMAVSTLAYLLIAAYSLGVSKGGYAVANLDDDLSPSAIRQAVESVEPNIGLAFVMFFGFMTYMIFLSSLPYILGMPKQDNVENESGERD